MLWYSEYFEIYGLCKFTRESQAKTNLCGEYFFSLGFLKKKLWISVCDRGRGLHTAWE